MSNVDLLKEVESQFVEEARKALEEFSEEYPLDKNFEIEVEVPLRFFKVAEVKYQREITIKTHTRRHNRIDTYEKEKVTCECVCVRRKGHYGYTWARISDLRGDDMKKFGKNGKRLLEGFGPAIRKEILAIKERAEYRRQMEQQETCDIRRSLKDILGE